MKKIVIAILIVMLLFNGLINERELNKLDIVSCIGIDLTENGEYEVTVSVLDTKKEGSGSSKESGASKTSNKTVYVGTNKSIQLALRSIVEKSTKKLYLAHLDLIMLSEKLVKEKEIMDILDYFIRDYEGGNNFILVILKDKGTKETIEALSENSNEFAAEIKETILTSHQYIGNTSDNSLGDDLIRILNEGEEVVINSIELEEINKEDEKKEEKELENKEQESEDSSSQKKKYKYKLSDMGYYKDNKLAGYLEETDNITYNALNNNIIIQMMQLNENDKRIVAEIISSKVSVKPEIKGEEYIVNIKQNVIANITELGNDVSINNEEEINKVKTEFSNLLKDNINKYIDNCKNKYDADVVGFGNLFYKYKYKEYEKVKDKFYTEIYDNIKVNVEVKVDILNMGGVEKNWQ